MTSPDVRDIRTIIVSGLSGSGKTTAIRALEDLGYFCMDNLPVILLEQVIQLCERGDITQVATVIDVREREFLAEFDTTLARIKGDGYPVETLFLTCDDDVIIRRFKETRRRHPLQGEGGIQAGITAEREALHAVRDKATRTLDTTNTNVHQLRRKVQDLFGVKQDSTMHVRLMSFGFKHGYPKEADYVFDVRFLPNPYFVEGLRHLSGCDAGVADFLREQPDSLIMLDHIEKLIRFVLPRADDEGKSQVVISIGCTGGQHRSVALAEWLLERLESTPYRLTVEHRNMK